jgi:hypothetical protein
MLNNRQNTTFHPLDNLLNPALAVLGQDLINYQFGKIYHFSNQP